MAKLSSQKWGGTKKYLENDSITQLLLNKGGGVI